MIIHGESLQYLYALRVKVTFLPSLTELTTKVQKRMRGSDSREAAVMDELEDICTAQNFVTYEYSPPRTVKACKLLVGMKFDLVNNVKKVFVTNNIFDKTEAVVLLSEITKFHTSLISHYWSQKAWDAAMQPKMPLFASNICLI